MELEMVLPPLGITSFLQLEEEEWLAGTQMEGPSAERRDSRDSQASSRDSLRQRSLKEGQKDLGGGHSRDEPGQVRDESP